MSTGARTVLISRWRTAGQTSYALVREFAQELPHTSAADAWQRAVQLAGDAPLDSDAEPRVRKSSSSSETVKADHPFFWAAYLLVDSGRLGDDQEPPPPPMINVPKKDVGPAAPGDVKGPAKGVAPAGNQPPAQGMGLPANGQLPGAGQRPAGAGAGPDGGAMQGADMGADPNHPPNKKGAKKTKVVKEPPKSKTPPRKKNVDPDDPQ